MGFGVSLGKRTLINILPLISVTEFLDNLIKICYLLMATLFFSLKREKHPHNFSASDYGLVKKLSKAQSLFHNSPVSQHMPPNLFLFQNAQLHQCVGLGST